MTATDAEHTATIALVHTAAYAVTALGVVREMPSDAQQFFHQILAVARQAETGLDVAAAAEVLGCDNDHVDALLASGALETVDVSGENRVNVATVGEMLAIYGAAETGLQEAAADVLAYVRYLHESREGAAALRDAAVGGFRKISIEELANLWDQDELDPATLGDN